MKRRKQKLPQAEEILPAARMIDSASSFEIAEIINREDQKVALAIGSQLKPISRAIDMAHEALSQGGRLFYVGAGSSGRLGVLDAAECPPTFGVSSTKVQGIIAGGRRALWRSCEGAEDDHRCGAQAIRKAAVHSKDIVCGISASGKTPFVGGALVEARKRKAKRILISCHPSPEMAELAELVIQPTVGPEVIAGSSRMKAGTATKMILNMISTGAMIRLGKVYENLMVDVKPTSAKLRERAERIIMSVLGCSQTKSQRLLRSSEGQAKVAIVMGAKGLRVKEARQRLLQQRGFLRKVL